MIAPLDPRIQVIALITPRSGEARASLRRRRRGYAGAVPETLRAGVRIEPRGRPQLRAGRPAPGRVVVADAVVPGGATAMSIARDPAGEPAPGRAQVVRDRARQARSAVQRSARGGRAVELAVVIPHAAESGHRRGAARTGGPRRGWRRCRDADRSGELRRRWRRRRGHTRSRLRIRGSIARRQPAADPVCSASIAAIILRVTQLRDSYPRALHPDSFRRDARRLHDLRPPFNL